MKRLFSFASRLVLSAVFLAVVAPSGFAQVRGFGGVKFWYANWDLRYQQQEGEKQSDYTAAFMAAPYLGIRVSDWAITASYGKSMKHFTSEASSDGRSSLAFNGNRTLSREDINVFLNYYVLPQLTFFANLKFLNYTVHDAINYIGNRQFTFKQEYKGTGFGLGAQVTVPFGPNNRFWSFINVGGVYNSFSEEVKEPTGFQYQDQDFNEGMYFLESGLGYWFVAGRFGATLGIRGERGEQTNTIFGPLAGALITL